MIVRASHKLQTKRCFLLTFDFVFFFHLESRTMITPDEASVGYRDSFKMRTVFSQVGCPKALPTLGGDRPNPVAQHVRGGQRESQPWVRCGAKWMRGRSG